jgi:hypothetical protein
MNQSWRSLCVRGRIVATYRVRTMMDPSDPGRSDTRDRLETYQRYSCRWNNRHYRLIAAPRHHSLQLVGKREVG